MTSRRDILKGGALLSFAGLAGAPGAAWAAGARRRFLIDGRLPEAPRLRRRAAITDNPWVDPEGEIIGLLLANPVWTERNSVLIGLTGYVDYALAGDFLRSVGRRIEHVRQLGPAAGSAAVAQDGASRGPIASLLDGPSTPVRPGVTSFLWIA